MRRDSYRAVEEIRRLKIFIRAEAITSRSSVYRRSVLMALQGTYIKLPNVKKSLVRPNWDLSLITVRQVC